MWAIVGAWGTVDMERSLVIVGLSGLAMKDEDVVGRATKGSGDRKLRRRLRVPCWWPMRCTGAMRRLSGDDSVVRS